MPPANPYAQRAAATAAATRGKENGPQLVEMGPQSQRRLTLKGRTHLMQQSSHKKKQKGDQQTLFGERAFDPKEDCAICKARHIGYAEPHRGHHKLCWNNKRTKGFSEATLSLEQEAKRLKQHFTTPLTEEEKCSGKHSTKEAGLVFFAPRVVPAVPKKTTTTTTTKLSTAVMTDNSLSGPSLCMAVTELVKDTNFVELHKDSRAPLAMLALAKVVAEKIMLDKTVDIGCHFNGLTMTVPANPRMEPQYHSIVGQKLLYVDWKRMYGLDIPCTKCDRGVLKNDRTNFSKNRVLFPMFGLDGAPMWCMVMSLTCPCCRWRVNANSCEVLCNLPAYARMAYPVDTKYALNKHSHIGRSATDVMDLLMPTYGNGDLCSRLLHNSINRAYIERVENYYSYYIVMEKEGTGSIMPYLEKDGQFIRAYPPLGDAIRDAHDEACSNTYAPWGISDHDRHTREIQSVACRLVFAQDHTHEVTKNYFQKKRLGATASWDVATETGEVASAVLVPSTKTEDFAHAAAALTRRKTFDPAAMCSDTWPVKKDFWELLFRDKNRDKKLEGRLGLFHFVQRITKTLKKKHVDHFVAINALLHCIYECQSADYENLLRALKEGTLSTKHTDEDIADLRASKVFRQRCDKHLRKVMRQPHVMCSMLDDWFHQFKCTASEDSRPARGRYDPFNGETLFSSETKEAIKNAKVNAAHLQDPLPLHQMCLVIQPSPNSQHQLPECISRRGESSLESFHLMLAHFGNCGMRTSLADNLNLTGTARHNLAIRQKIRLVTLTLQNPERKKTPAAFESVASCYNHSELNHVNKLALAVGVSGKDVPFKRTEMLPADNGERFFSEHLDWMRATKPKFDILSRCLCDKCDTTLMGDRSEENSRQHSPQQIQQTNVMLANDEMNATTVTTHSDTMTTKNSEEKQIATTVNNPSTERPTQQPLPLRRVHQPMQPQPQPQPQQLFHYHHHQQHHAHQNHQHPLAIGYTPTMPQFSPWVMMPNPFSMPTQAAAFCCSRHRHWHNTVGRRGRPPHDDHCQQMRRRLSVKPEKNRNDNPSWRAI